MTSYRYGDSLSLLDDDKAITTRGLWAMRAISLLILLNALPNFFGGQYYRFAGNVIAIFAIYYAGLWLFSSDIDEINEPIEVDEAGETDPSSVLEWLSSDEVTTQRELKQAVDLSSTDYADADEWWSAEAQPLLEEHDNVEKLDDTGRRWQLSD